MKSKTIRYPDSKISAGRDLSSHSTEFQEIPNTQLKAGLRESCSLQSEGSMVLSGINKMQGKSCHLYSTGSLVITRSFQMNSYEMKSPFGGKVELLGWKYDESAIIGSCEPNAAMIESLRPREDNTQIPPYHHPFRRRPGVADNHYIGER